MATSTQSRSRKTSNGATHHAAQALQTMSRRSAKRGRQLSADISREASALTQRAGALLGSAVKSTRRHPWIALGAVATLGALLSGAAYWYRQR